MAAWLTSLMLNESMSPLISERSSSPVRSVSMNCEAASEAVSEAASEAASEAVSEAVSE